MTTTDTTTEPRRRRERMALSLAAVLAATAAFSTGAAASFTTSVAASQTIGSGIVSLALGAEGAATNRLTVEATDIVPGDTIQRSVDLVNDGSVDLSAASLTTTATTSSLLDTDTTNGLQMVVDSCSTGWIETTADAGYDYTCAGVQSTLISSRPVIGSDLDLAGIEALAAGGTTHLRVTLTLPETADNSFQGQSSTIEYGFAGIQRAPENR